MTETHRVYLGVGANLQPAEHVAQALAALPPAVVPDGVGPCFWSDALDRPEQPRYLNTVFAGTTGLAPRDLRAALRNLEAALGRRRTADRYASRPIDLDLLLYDDRVIHDGALQVPDPDLRTRAFIVLPLYDLAPDLRLPDTGEPLAAVAAALDATGLDPDPDLTARLRRRLP